ncbi:MAG: polysaccharide biosynthesis tyrosine autokinase [Anaerolineaceae bacterium]|jgi:capsular exopolysaccharide synthesis family protein|nr:polysaccharide biosynthesis tyrosine autokinase [Anaerolineaceae bacterium]
MELINYLNILLRRKWIVILTMVFAVLVVAVGTLSSPPMYTASTTIRILTARAGGTDYVDYAIQYAERLAGTYVDIATSSPILEELGTYVFPLPKITVEVIPNTELIKMSAESSDPALAQFAANKLAEILIVQSREIYGSDTKLYVIDPAVIPAKPSSPKPALLIALSVVAGLLGGVGLAFLFESLDTRLYTDREIQALTELPLIGDIPDDKRRGAEGLLIDSQLQAESFRRLRTNIFSPVLNQGIKTFLVTSPVRQDGRTSITANLGVIMSQGNRNVVIVDADLRESKMHEKFGLENDKGLSDVLAGKAALQDVLQKTAYPRLSVVTSGGQEFLNTELLDSPAMSKILEELKEKFDVVLLDSPSSVSVTDPAVLAPKVDAVMVVVRHGWVRREAMYYTMRNLRGVGAKLLGVITNRTELGTSSRLLKLQRQSAPTE